MLLWMCLNVVPRSLMTNRLPTELVNVKTTDTGNLDEKEIVSDSTTKELSSNIFEVQFYWSSSTK